MIEMKDKLYLKIINFNFNLAEASYADLEKLVQILKGNTLNNWNALKNSYLLKSEKVMNWWRQEIKDFNEKLKKEIVSLYKFQQNQQEENFYECKEDLYEILFTQKIQMDKFSKGLWIYLKKEKISDCLKLLSNMDSQKLYYQNIDNNIKMNDLQNNILKIAKII
ncbi:unnamed protein product [Paramecium pentaurelia]|uniref:Uncharacterized protein n=1 Tax=Paramecium pentaurelia TaxID=43138 RepID=A0A8S1Y7H2_9CILI|nr:unnamed protein product [Paramecium pentaurelia]